MAIDLNKTTEAAGVSLQKAMQVSLDKGHDPGDVEAAVILALDFSGSMAQRYNNGEVTTVATRCLALSLTGLDDDGTIQVIPFHNSAFPLELVTEANYRTFVDDFRSRHQMGGTSYLAPIKAIVQFCEKNDMLKKGKPPVFVIFVTDGEPDYHERPEIIKLLKKLADEPIFWLFVGLGYSPDFLSGLDTMGGRKVDNVGLVDFQDTLGMSDGDFFDTIVREFVAGADGKPSWLVAARAAGVLR